MFFKLILFLFISTFFINESHSTIRDFKFSNNNQSLSINFENFRNESINKFSFLLHSQNDFKFKIEKFGEDLVQIKQVNLVNSIELNGEISFKKLQNEKNYEVVHYELLMNTSLVNNFCWELESNKSHTWWGAPANPGAHSPIKGFRNKDLSIKEQPFIGGKSLESNSLGSIIEYLWLSSYGYLVFVERDVPLFISLENGTLCLNAKNNIHPYEERTNKIRSPFKAHIVITKDIKKAHLYYLDKFVEKPESTPNPSIYKSNIWTTWTRFKTDINQNILIEWAKNISKFGFTKYNSVFEIDDKWEKYYGSAKFDENRFPNAKQMINEIKQLGFNTSIWLTPFFNQEVVDNLLTQEEINLMIKELNSTNALRLDWWQGKNATCIDLSNPKARNWFTKRIKNLLDTHNIDTFKADAGEVSWFDRPFKLFSEDADLAPNKYAEYYSLMIKDFKSPLFIEMRSSFNSQKHSNVIRILDKESVWGYDNGLQSIIPSYLIYSLFGYPFIMPDIVGGNAYQGKPDKELYLRWLAVNSLLPIVQYSMGPFDYDQEAIEIGLKFQELHNKYVPLFIKLAENAKKTGQPIIRPIWYLDPDDVRFWYIDNQYLIGDKVLVAPILEKGETKRAIWLPKGKWFDELRSRTIQGPSFLKNYEIKLDEIAYFTRLSD